MNRWSNVLDAHWIILKSYDHQVCGVKGEILKSSFLNSTFHSNCHADNAITADPGRNQVGQLIIWLINQFGPANAYK